MIEIKIFLSRAAVRNSRGVATLEEAIGEMICDKTHWKHSIKAGADFPKRPRANLCSPQKAIMNERRIIMKHKRFKEPAQARGFLRAGSLQEARIRVRAEY